MTAASRPPDPREEERHDDWQSVALFPIAKALYDHAEDLAFRNDYINASFDCGALKAALAIIEDQIDPDYQPFKEWQARLPEERLRRVIESGGLKHD